jgi:hypothetical protein
MTARRYRRPQGMGCVLAGHDRSQTRRGGGKPAVISVADPAVRVSVRTERIPQPC